MSNVLPFPSYSRNNRFGKAPGKHSASSPINREHTLATSTSPPGEGASTPPQSTTTFHMEVTIKLTQE